MFLHQNEYAYVHVFDKSSFVITRITLNTVSSTRVSFTFFSKTLDPLVTKNGKKEVHNKTFDSLTDICAVAMAT